MPLTGELFIGAARRGTAKTFAAIDPATHETLRGAFALAGAEHVEAACALAESAFDAFRELPLQKRADFLEACAGNIEKLGDELIVRAMAETGLPRARLEGERARTTGQLRLFASVVRRGDFLSARIDPALPERKPAPRPDLRLRKIAVGPVAVFGASNFPLAFSVAGGDTASAFAAGCPVVVKAHSSHPGVSELVASAIAAAVEEKGLPEGIFSMLSGSHEMGSALVADPRIKAVGFTGSRGGGLALMRIAQARPEPIPVYAEMSSINPVLLLPHALEKRAEALGAAFVGSLTLGAGQFCTNPSLVLAIESPAIERFAKAAADALAQTAPAVMLSPRIHQAYVAGVEALQRHKSAELVGRGAEGDARCGRGALFSTTAEAFRSHKGLSEEVFGASSLIVHCKSEADFAAIVRTLEGQLTASVHLDADDRPLAAKLLPLLERKVGRIIANGWPTGVEVAHAMVHGGPFPSTSDGRSTSVGTLAIERFLRPVCYQDVPDALLPPALQSDNPLDIRRLVDGEWA